MNRKYWVLGLVVGWMLLGRGAAAQEAPTTATLKAGGTEGLTVAVFDFSARDKALEEAGAVLAEMVRVQLQAKGTLRLVAREEMDKILGEQKLALAGVTEEAAPRVGKLLGAQVLVLGRVFKLGGDLLATAKVVGVETSRVYGEMARGGQERIDAVGMELGEKVGGLIEKGGETLVAKVRLTGEQIAALKAKLAGKPLPRVYVYVREAVANIHVPDPAAQTEISYILKKIGCEVVKDSGGALAAWATAYLDGGSQTAPPAGAGVDLVLVGEGISQFASRTGDLVSSRARVELEALGTAGPNAGKVLAVDRETFVGVDLAEQIAAKTALQEAAARLVLRLAPEAVAAWRAGGAIK